MDLQTLQRSFQSRLLGGRGDIETHLANAATADFDDRLRAYTNGYTSRLVEALGVTYPALRNVLGAEEFDALMARYVAATPSRHYSIRYYGDNVAAFLQARTDLPGAAVLGELAHWEWTLADAFDAADDVPVTPQRLAQVSPDAWGNVCFGFRASVRVVTTRSNAVQWWRATQGDCEMPQTFLAAPAAHWLVWRRDLRTMFRSMDEVEHAALSAARHGATFGDICGQVAQCVGDEEAPLRSASILRGWFGDEILTDIMTSRSAE